MQARGQLAVPPHTSLGSHLHPVPIPSLRSWHGSLIQRTGKQGLSLSPRWEPLPPGRQGTGRAGLSLCRLQQRGSSCQSHGASAACFP